MSIFDDENDSKRTLGSRDKQILYIKANKRCENPKCNKEIDYLDMQVGHKQAWSKGGRTTLKNSVCLCYTCNKLQGTDSWATFLKKQGIEDKNKGLKESLENLNINQLKSLADKHHIKVKGKVEETLFSSYRKAPTKKQFISKLKGVVSEKDINSLDKEVTETKTNSNKETLQNPISKKKLLNKLPITKLKKIAKELDIDPDNDSRIFVVDKDEYIEVLSGSRKATVEKIQEILGL